ncbi:MAG TPA: DUF5996 family protein [Pyrinomonadaceae bacterium]|nr:DUF5996 family protein [Pyrinomonadaceae bacterium]
MNRSALPELPLSEWQDTLATLHMWSQIVGKIALARTPLINHFWNTTLRITPRGFRTLPLNNTANAFMMEFDFIYHELVIKCESGDTRRVKLEPRSVADFYSAVMGALHELNVDVKIWTMPVEVENPIRFTDDTQHASYDPEYVERFRQILVWTNGVFEDFRSRFIGKSSPVHFFWGSFDLAVTRFNGERAPEREGADYITREAYSHKNISHGFWCGGGAVQEPAFYGYAAPEPEGFKEAKILPAQGYYHKELGEFILPYEAVRQSSEPEKTLLDFMQCTYDAAADLANWKRGELERQ